MYIDHVLFKKSKSRKQIIPEDYFAMNYFNIIATELFAGVNNYHKLEEPKKKLIMKKYLMELSDADVLSLVFNDEFDADNAGDEETIIIKIKPKALRKIVLKLKDLYKYSLNPHTFRKLLVQHFNKQIIQKINHDFKETEKVKNEITTKTMEKIKNG